jgi:hypothetical protein
MNVSPFPKIHLIPEDKELKDGQWEAEGVMVSVLNVLEFEVVLS